VVVIAWIVVAFWGLVLLASARPSLRGLPPPIDAVPPYALWLPDGGEAPALEPAPEQVIRGALIDDGPELVLVLGADVTVDPSLPGRLSACGPFVSVFPRPRGGLVRRAVERLLRDFANPPAVVDARNPAGYADERCVWMRRTDLALPAEGAPGGLRAARARKAHGLTVDLRDGFAGDSARGPVMVSAPGQTVGTLSARVPALTAPEPVARMLMVTIPLTACLSPWPFLVDPATREIALLAIGLGTAARLMTAVRDGFGLPLAVLGWLIEPLLALVVWRAPRHPDVTTMPEVPADAPELTGADGVKTRPWLDHSAVAHLARRLGGAAPVMEQVYRNVPAGTSRRGRRVDRWIHASPGARAVRYRWVAVAELARRIIAGRIVSVPCGSAADVGRLEPVEAVLIDPDPAARALARARCPAARVIDGTVETAPDGPFDLAVYVGLAEYLDDNAVIAHLCTLRSRLAPGGHLITSTTAEHESQGRMGEWLGWRTRQRSAEAMVALVERAGFEVLRRRVDPNGIQWIFLARIKPPDRSDRFTSSELRVVRG